MGFESVFCMKTAIVLVGAGAHKGGKIKIVFGPTLNPILSIFWERKRGKLYLLTKVGLSTFKEIL